MPADWSFILPALLLLSISVLFLRRIWKAESYPFQARDFLLSDAELHFFHALEKAIPSAYVIAPKVRLGDVIGCSDADWANGHGPKISAKHLDFVVIDRRTSRIILAVELDDSSHLRKDRRNRDLFVNRALEAAGVPLLRIQTATSYPVSELKREIERATPAFC
jgi:hypothetical protein